MSSSGNALIFDLSAPAASSDGLPWLFDPWLRLSSLIAPACVDRPLPLPNPSVLKYFAIAFALTLLTCELKLLLLLLRSDQLASGNAKPKVVSESSKYCRVHTPLAPGPLVAAVVHVALTPPPVTLPSIAVRSTCKLVVKEPDTAFPLASFFHVLLDLYAIWYVVESAFV